MQVIDYGLTKLDDHYSWATGWVETQLAEQRLRASSSVSPRSPSVGHSSLVDDEVVAAITDRSASQRLAARQARKLQRKWNKPNGFEWWGVAPAVSPLSLHVASAAMYLLPRRCTYMFHTRQLGCYMSELAPVREGSIVVAVCTAPVRVLTPV